MKKLGLALAFTLVAGTASAANYGPAGCGLGSMIFEDKESTFQQILASTTNGSTYTQLFGITSGTSNCEDDGRMGYLKTRDFVAANRAELETEAARGTGETLASLSVVMGCQDGAALNSKLQNSYSDIFSADDNYAVSDNLIKVVQSDAELSSGCNAIL